MGNYCATRPFTGNSKGKSMSKEKKIALVDMDGCIADWNTPAVEQLKELESPDEVGLYDYNNVHLMQEKYPHFSNRVNLIMERKGFWLNLEPIQAGIRLYRILSEYFDTYILTKAPAKSSLAWGEKVEWLHRHIDPKIDKIITVSKDKGMVYGDIFFEDYGKNIRSWTKKHPHGHVIMPNRTWNQEIQGIPNVHRWDDTLWCPTKFANRHDHLVMTVINKVLES